MIQGLSPVHQGGCNARGGNKRIKILENIICGLDERPKVKYFNSILGEWGDSSIMNDIRQHIRIIRVVIKETLF